MANNVMSLALEMERDHYDVKWSPELCEGVSYHRAPDANDVLRKQYESTLPVKSVTREGVPIPMDQQAKFVSLKRCSPNETLAVLRGNKVSKRPEYDFSDSDLYLNKITFKYRGTTYHKYQYMLHVRKGGYSMLSGTQTSIIPFVSDKIISPGGSFVFLRLMKHKIKIEKFNASIRVYRYSERFDNYACPVYYSQLHKNNTNYGNARGRPKPKHALMVYLLAYYGFEETFSLLAGYVPEVIHVSQIAEYTDKGYLIVSSPGNRPSKVTMPDETGWVEPTTLLAFDFPDVGKGASDRDAYLWKLTFNRIKVAATAYFYIGDHYAPLYNTQVDNGILGIPEWRSVLGQIIAYREPPSEQAKVVNIHMNSLIHSYVDKFMISKFKDEFGDTLGIELSTEGGFFQLLGVIINNSSDWFKVSSSITKSMFDKRYVVLYHTLLDISISLNKMARLLEVKEYPPSAFQRLLDMHILKAKIFSITKSNSTRSSLIPTDSYMFKMSLVSGIQSVSSGMKSKKSTNYGRADNVEFLDSTHSIAAGIGSLTKQSIEPILINPFAPYNPELNKIVPTETDLNDIVQLDEVLEDSLRNIPDEYKMDVGKLPDKKFYTNDTLTPEIHADIEAGKFDF